MRMSEFLTTTDVCPETTAVGPSRRFDFSSLKKASRQPTGQPTARPTGQPTTQPLHRGAKRFSFSLQSRKCRLKLNVTCFTHVLHSTCSFEARKASMMTSPRTFLLSAPAASIPSPKNQYLSCLLQICGATASRSPST
jgi:hypothetical protein